MTPRVGIGIPVYNGEKYLCEAIESVLAQSFTDFELIISDNASTDSTEHICRHYAAKDSRIRYYRNDKNIGAAKNCNRTFELSCSRYFKWMAVDCTIEPEFLQRCVDLLDRDKDIILTCSYCIGHIETTGARIKLEGNFALKSPEPYQRFCDALKRVVAEGGNGPIWALMRSDVLRQSRLIKPIIGGDDYLLLELALKGKFGQIPEFLAMLRRHRDSYTDISNSNSGVEGIVEAKWFDTDNKAKILLPHWRRLWEYFLIAMRSGQPIRAKLLMVATLFYPIMLRWSKIMSKELLFAAHLGKYYIKLARVIKKYTPGFSSKSVQKNKSLLA